MWLNLLGFNIVWLGLVILGNSFIPVALTWLLWHIYRCSERMIELTLIGMIAITGILIDSLLIYFDVLSFQDHPLIPLWLVMLWLCFAATIRHSLMFLSDSKWLQLLVGAIFPPAAYISGAHLVNISFGYSLPVTFTILALIWATLFLLIFSYLSPLASKKVRHV